MSDAFSFVPDPDHSGWMRWELRDPTRFNAFLGPILTRLEGDKALVRMATERRHSNLADSTHGGALLGFMDAALFAAARTFGVLSAGGAVTLDLSAQFIGTSRIGEPIVAEVELLRETGRMLFMRGLVKQDDAILASFSGTVRKSSPRA
ncbi:PaaI family thioesterase [Sphingomonas suaedae]|uniref:PaaI family thioesterase n=1 Tax=Sphingomonas suaedae TaxID=2599297 RepID=A0A518RFL7_9SPHN|nr:PaaI family thioesterase [Sphingomonas suaedae]QDX26262.1 PaaI family thioesterase [Sphingomonas suaedae]